MESMQDRNIMGIMECLLPLAFQPVLLAPSYPMCLDIVLLGVAKDISSKPHGRLAAGGCSCRMLHYRNIQIKSGAKMAASDETVEFKAWMNSDLGWYRGSARKNVYFLVVRLFLWQPTKGEPHLVSTHEDIHMACLLWHNLAGWVQAFFSWWTPHLYGWISRCLFIQHRCPQNPHVCFFKFPCDR